MLGFNKNFHLSGPCCQYLWLSRNISPCFFCQGSIFVPCESEHLTKVNDLLKCKRFSVKNSFTKWKLQNLVTAKAKIIFVFVHGLSHLHLSITLDHSFLFSSLSSYLCLVLIFIWVGTGVDFKEDLERQVLNSRPVLGNLHSEMCHYLTNDCCAVDSHAPGERGICSRI